MLTPPEAEARIRAEIPTATIEECPLADAQGRILRQEVRADRDLPPFDRVTLDGYALRSAALAGGIRKFRIEAVQAAGMIARRLGAEADVCVKVMTGAVRPEGADCVVPLEDTDRGEAVVTVSGDAAGRIGAGHAVHERGSDHRAGDPILSPGLCLGGREIAVAAACGCESLKVAARPRIMVVATGDELVEIAMPVAAHQVRRSNDYAIRASLIRAGFPQVECHHLRDRRDEIEHHLWHLLAEYDTVLLTGGVSKGEFDYLPSVLEALQVRPVFHGVAQRPGKPMWFGMTTRRTPVFALPGNPVSSFTCLHRYVLPALYRAAGAVERPALPVRLAAKVTFRPRLTRFLPVRLETDASGDRRARPQPTNTSGDFAGLMASDGFVELPAELETFPAGFAAPYREWT